MTTVVVTRLFGTPQERVWSALTDQGALAAWFWPEQLEAEVRMDARTGGDYRIASVPAGMAVSGTVIEAASPQRLVMSWRWDGEDVESLVAIDLRPAGDGTELRLQHDQLVDERTQEMHEEGWSDCLDRLPAYLERS
jgi:uncharacterized protein YndB with AHSA1/START domain